MYNFPGAEHTRGGGAERQGTVPSAEGHWARVHGISVRNVELHRVTVGLRMKTVSIRTVW